MIRKLPLYLALDLLGKFLILASVGIQLLILTPQSSERSRSQIEALLRLEVSNLRTNASQLGLDPNLFGPSSEHDLRKLLENDLLHLFGAMTAGGLMGKAYMSVLNLLMIAIFVIGSALTIVGTYFEKRNRPAP